MNFKHLLKEYIQILLEDDASLDVPKDRPSAQKAKTRAQKSKSAGPAGMILINELNKKYPDAGWFVKSAAVTGSSTTDIVLSNTSGQDTAIEVKDYGSNTLLKVEISLIGESALAKAYGISKKAFSASEESISSRIVGDNAAEVLEKIKLALQSPGATYIDFSTIKVKNDLEDRHIIVVKGEVGDWKRVRHSSKALGGSRRMLYTVPTSAVAAAATKQPTSEEIASAIVDDFVSKGDEYLILFDGSSSIRVFTLTGSDSLGLNAPTLTGNDIKNFRLSTHGGGIRPSVFVEIKSTSGLVLS